MTSQERFELDVGAMRYDMDSIDVDNALEEAGLDSKTCSVEDAKNAIREYTRKHGLPPFPLRVGF